ncbi:MAG: hypothetical protein ACI9OE_002838 [Mariniflexile sp.]|jgi:hypothetical protein
MDDLTLLLSFLKRNDFQWNGWTLCASIKIDALLKDDLIKYDDMDHLQIKFEDENYDHVDINDVELELTIKISFELPRTDECFVAKNVDDLIKRTSIITPPKYYEIYDDKVNDDAYTYKKLCEFIKICIENDVLEKHHNVDTLVLFYSNTKVVIPCKSINTNFNKDLGKNLNNLIEKFNSDKHKADRIHMLRSSLFAVLNNCQESNRLNHLLENSVNFVKLFEQNYDLFMSEFSFDSEKETIFTAKREFLLKLSQLISGIQGKLLAIPLSLVLVLGQMKTKPEDNPLLVNTLIMVSALVFTVIMLIILISQLTSIAAIKSEVSSKKERFELELSNLYQEVKIAFDSVLSQCLYNKLFIYFLIIIVIFGLLGSTVAYILLTPEIKEYFEPLFLYVQTKFGWFVELYMWSYSAIKSKFMMG